MAWGNNNAGQLGDGNETNSDVPVEVKGLNGVKSIAAGVQHSLALLGDGKVMAWGENGSGALGNGDRESSDVPVQASELSAVTAIAAGGYSSYAEQGEIGEVTGEVTSVATSSPIEGAKVCAMNIDGGEPWRCATTDAAGEYTVTVHESGNYDVRFSAPSGSSYVASEYYNGKPSSSEETAVPVTLGATNSGIDAQLAEGGRIAGIVTSASTKTPVADVEVCARESSAECVLTDTRGEYSISGLVTGNYEVEFYSNNGMYLPQYWDGKRLATEGQLVPVALSQTTSGIDAELEPLTNGAITGNVRDGTTMQGIKGIDVCAYDIGGEEVGGGEEIGGLFGQCTETNDRGEYAIPELATGEYLIEFSSPYNSGLNYVTQYFNASSSVADATLVHVEAKSVATGIDAQLNEGGRIAGNVTDASTTAAIAGIEVCAYSTSAESFGCASTDSKGEYTISALSSGDYDVEFYAPSDSGLDYVTQYYDGERKAVSEADPVPVKREAPTGIDAELEEGGRIAGEVTDASTGAVIKGVLVCALGQSAKAEGCAVTDTSGEYTITGLVDGQYKVGFDDGKNYIIQYYNNKLSFSEAQEVPVSAGDTASGIDAAMSSSDAIPPTNTKPPVVLGTPAVGRNAAVRRWPVDGQSDAEPDRQVVARRRADTGGDRRQLHGPERRRRATASPAKSRRRAAPGNESAVSAGVAIPGSPPIMPQPRPGRPSSPSITTTSSGATGVKSYMTGSKSPITITASTLAVSGGSARVHVQCAGGALCRDGRVDDAGRDDGSAWEAGRLPQDGAGARQGIVSIRGQGRERQRRASSHARGQPATSPCGQAPSGGGRSRVSAPGVKTIVIRSVLAT